MEKLEEVEQQVLMRVATGNYECEYSALFAFFFELVTDRTRAVLLPANSSGSTVFWTPHCHAVDLAVPMQKAIEAGNEKGDKVNSSVP